MTDIIEIIARRFCRARCTHTDPGMLCDTRCICGPNTMDRTRARSVVADITVAGFAIVPREPTRAMLDAGGRDHDLLPSALAHIYCAMLSAGEVKPTVQQESSDA